MTADPLLSGLAWQRVSRGLFVKLVGQALGGLAVAGVLWSALAGAVRPIPVLAAICCVAVGLDAIGRLLCLFAPGERNGRRQVLQSVVAQALAVAFAAAAFPWPFWRGTKQPDVIRAIFVLLAFMSQLMAAQYFTRFLGELARHFNQPRLESVARSLGRVLGIPAKVVAVGSVVVVAAAVLTFLVVMVITIGFGWLIGAFLGFAVGGILSIPFVMALLVFIGAIQVRYAVLVFRLAQQTGLAAKELDESKS